MGNVTILYEVAKLNRRFVICILCMIFLVHSASGTQSQAAVPAEQTSQESIFLPIIMYHEIKTYKAGKDVILPWEFESDLKYLAENDYVPITMDQLIDYVFYGTKLPEKPIILSFDDGYLNTYFYAVPLLKKYHMKIVMSIIVKNADDFSQFPDDHLDYAHTTWTQINDMLASGFVEVQNHSYNLHSIRNGRIGSAQKKNESFSDYERLFEEDIQKSQERIYEMTGDVANTFVYPYGQYSDNTDLVLKNNGFLATLSCIYGINLISTEPEDLYRLKRICRSHGKSVQKLLKEAYKTIR